MFVYYILFDVQNAGGNQLVSKRVTVNANPYA
jgi:hypothetical protein